MLIGIDAIHLSRNRKGIGRVERSIIQTLARRSHAHHFVVFLDRDHDSLGLPTCGAVTYSVSPTGSLFAWEQFQLPRLARRYEVELLLSFSDRIPWILPGNVVMYLFEVPDYRREMAIAADSVSIYQRASDLITQMLFPHSLRRAKHVAVASRATGRDLRRRYGMPTSKVSVVPAAADACFRPQPDPVLWTKMRKRFGAPDGFVLHFATEDPRENTLLALQAFAQARIPGVMKMIVVGGASSTRDNLMGSVGALGLSERVLLTRYLPEKDLVELYQAASAYLDPSLYEGFGLQVLEAMACGVPVVCSNATSLPETVGDAAITCDPDDVAAFSAGLEAVLNNPERAAMMRAAGLRQAARFSWQRTTRELIRICERAAD
ncbi:MAG: glycosyltransferase family 1 protein [Anaerolineales bacterium]|jgi:glycosyltransferase involved in cell wall biosynthesis|nr:glycosyltransferase family 1 protein [Anaerolineales bacterium]HJO32890.1 glycosyltransferase family 1 protein [Anaerolineales bacterium]|tara:strand:+ start:2191 stop:3321 length:1131 start_codon:yes stop_codon:yes gene_type:complete